MQYVETVSVDFDSTVNGRRLSHEVRGYVERYKPYKNQGRFGNPSIVRPPEGALAGVL